MRKQHFFLSHFFFLFFFFFFSIVNIIINIFQHYDLDFMLKYFLFFFLFLSLMTDILVTDDFFALIKNLFSCTIYIDIYFIYICMFKNLLKKNWINILNLNKGGGSLCNHKSPLSLKSIGNMNQTGNSYTGPDSDLVDLVF